MNENYSTDVIDIKSMYVGYDDTRSFEINVKKSRTILKDLSKYILSEEIKFAAELIFKKMRVGIKRKNARKKLLWYCVYNAYLELGIPIAPETLAQMFDLKNTDMPKASNMYSNLQTGYEPPEKETLPEELVPQYCSKMELSEECSDDIIDLIRRVTSNIEFPKNIVPQVTAGASIKYYMDTNGIKPSDKGLLYKIIRRSEVTLTPIYDIISSIDNKM